MALKQFEKDYDLSKEQLEPYFLDLKKYRQLSSEIASKFNVHHESPQVLLIKNGNSVYDTSHGSISFNTIKEKI
ncbi:MAG: bacillithiol system redox-active protein YtxJ, partial [Leeuwenhoekiella sp.]